MIENLSIKEHHYNLAYNLHIYISENWKKKKLIIGIAGESGCGKSITGHCLRDVYEENETATSYLQMDDYFLLPPAANHENRKKSLKNIGPKEVNLELLEKNLVSFLNNENILAPESDFVNKTFSTRKVDFKHKEILIVEGTYIPLLKNLDLLIFIDIDYKNSLDKRIQRGRESFDPFVEEVLAIEHDIISKFKTQADILVDKNYKLVKSNV